MGSYRDVWSIVVFVCVALVPSQKKRGLLRREWVLSFFSASGLTS